MSHSMISSNADQVYVSDAVFPLDVLREDLVAAGDVNLAVHTPQPGSRLPEYEAEEPEYEEEPEDSPQPEYDIEVQDYVSSVGATPKHDVESVGISLPSSFIPNAPQNMRDSGLLARTSTRVSEQSFRVSVSNSVEVEMRDPPKTARQILDQNAEMWDEYNKMADKEDREFVKAANENLNTLLIFAGIFAAINAAFIVETFKNLREEPLETTNELLRTMITNNLPNSSSPQPLPNHNTSTFTPKPRDIRTNFVFFCSLCTSLAGSFLAVSGKQWLSHYEHEGSLKPPAERARERQRKFEGREKHRLQAVVESLPTLLQIALLAFLAGLADLLWPLSQPIASCVIFFTGSIFVSWVALTMIATWLPSFPYQTRLSIVLRHITSHNYRRRSTPTIDQALSITIRIVGQMLKNTTLTDTRRVNILANCFDAIPDDAYIKDLGDVMIKFHLGSLLISSNVSEEQMEKLTKRSEFRSLGVLRIVRVLLKNPTALDADIKRAIVSRIYLMSWQGIFEPEAADVMADIIAEGAVQIGKTGDLPSSHPEASHSTQYRNTSIALASRLCGELTKGKLNIEEKRHSLNILFSCLPKKYSEDVTFTEILKVLVGHFESLPPDDESIQCLADSMKRYGFPVFSHEASLTTEAYTATEELQSLPMLQLIHLAINSPSPGLGADVRKAIISNLYPGLWADAIEIEKGTVIAEIIATDPVEAEVQEMQYNYLGKNSVLVSEPQILLASSLCRRLVTSPMDKKAVIACLNLFNQSLSRCELDEQPVGEMLTILANYYESLPTGDPNIELLANSMLEFGSLKPFKRDRRVRRRRPGVIWELPDDPMPSLNDITETPTMPDMFWSMPMLRIIHILFKSPSALRPHVRKEIILCLWPQFWQDSTRTEKAEVISQILAWGATELMKIRVGDYPCWESSLDLNSSHYRNLATVLASHLCRRLADTESIDEDSAASCLSLFYYCLPFQDENRATMLGDLLPAVMNLQQLDKDGAYLVYLRLLLTDLMVSAPTSRWENAAFNYILQDPSQLQYLRDILDGSASEVAHGGLGLALCMTLWHHRESDQLTVNDFLLSEFTKSAWFSNTIKSLLQQNPADLSQSYFLFCDGGPVPPARLTWDEGFSMLERLCSYLVHIFRNSADYAVGLADVTSIRYDYEKWCTWLDSTDLARTLGRSEDVDHLVLALDKEVETYRKWHVTPLTIHDSPSNAGQGGSTAAALSGPETDSTTLQAIAEIITEDLPLDNEGGMAPTDLSISLHYETRAFHDQHPEDREDSLGLVLSSLELTGQTSSGLSPRSPGGSNVSSTPHDHTPAALLGSSPNVSRSSSLDTTRPYRGSEPTRSAAHLERAPSPTSRIDQESPAPLAPLPAKIFPWNTGGWFGRSTRAASPARVPRNGQALTAPNETELNSRQRTSPGRSDSAPIPNDLSRANTPIILPDRLALPPVRPPSPRTTREPFSIHSGLRAALPVVFLHRQLGTSSPNLMHPPPLSGGSPEPPEPHSRYESGTSNKSEAGENSKDVSLSSLSTTSNHFNPDVRNRP